MITMEYCAEGTAVSDWDVEVVFGVLAAPPRGDARIKYSTANIFHRVRQGIAEEEVDHRHVLFVFDGQSVVVNEYGMIHDWPRGFLSNGDVHSKILRAGVYKRKRRRAELDKEKE